MSHKSKNNGNNSAVIVVTVLVLGLGLVTTVSFSHSYIVFAVPKKNVSGPVHINDIATLGSVSMPSSSSGSADTASSNVLTNKQLNSFISCIKTANGSEGITHKVFTSCLDIAKTKSPTLSLLLSLPDQVADGLQNSKGSNNNDK
jgi:hypothetical protein